VHLVVFDRAVCTGGGKCALCGRLDGKLLHGVGRIVSFGSVSLPEATPEQIRRWALIGDDGCLCCRLLLGIRRFCEIHHQTVGGKHGAPRLGHDFTIGLCPWHHRGEAFVGEDADTWGPSYAKTPKAFRDEFGSDSWLLGVQNNRIGWKTPPRRQRRRKSRCTASSKQVKRPAGGFA